MPKIKYKGCKYCDGANYHHPYGKDESQHCVTCGAEWEPVDCEDYIDEEDDKLWFNACMELAGETE